MGLMPENDANVTRTLLLCGVGGQGTILASDLLSRTIQAAGLDVKMSEIHGMAQRGGAVTTIVRFGAHVNSMVCDMGSADYILSFETTEALRNISFLKEGGTLLVNDESMKPQPVLTGNAKMPANAKERLRALGGVLIPATRLAREAGSPKSANVVLLGALAASMPFSTESWESVIAAKVPPATIEANILAFHLGLDAVRSERHSSL